MWLTEDYNVVKLQVVWVLVASMGHMHCQFSLQDRGHTNNYTAYLNLLKSLHAVKI